MNQIKRVGFKHVRGQIGTPHVQGEGRIRKPLNELSEICRVDIDTGDSPSHGPINVLQSIACRTAENEHGARQSALQRVAQQATEYRTLIDGWTAHVTDVV